MNKSQKAKIVEYFSKETIRLWEDSDGVNYAIALARITGWLLHVDWWRAKHEETDVNKMKSLRVYVGDNADNIYDVKGKKRIAPFTNNVIMPLATKIGRGKGEVLTRYYSEQNLLTMPLRVKPDLLRINKAEKIIRSATGFLKTLSIRQSPFIPADQAANFTFGHCAVFATALSDVTKLPSTAIIALRYGNLFSNSKLGYVHSFNFYPDGSAEDVWGIQTIEKIAARFGIEEYKLSEEEHQKVNNNLKNNSPEKYNQIYEEAISLIKSYRQ